MALAAVCAIRVGIIKVDRHFSDNNSKQSGSGNLDQRLELDRHIQNNSTASNILEENENMAPVTSRGSGASSAAKSGPAFAADM